jgi:hypothetical protein
VKTRGMRLSAFDVGRDTDDHDNPSTTVRRPFGPQQAVPEGLPVHYSGRDGGRYPSDGDAIGDGFSRGQEPRQLDVSHAVYHQPPKTLG